MFRMLGIGQGAFSSAEKAALGRLWESQRGLIVADGGELDVVSGPGNAACAAFLSDLERAARALGIRPASRVYRDDFSANYRALFVDKGRRYRVDVLETSLTAPTEICVNGEMYELSEQLRCCGDMLQVACLELRAAVERWHVSVPTRRELTAVLEAFDGAWATFECSYITELMSIETKARQILWRVVACELELQGAESRGGPQSSVDIERKLVSSIAHLNSVANSRCTGRDDLGYGILREARLIIGQCKLERSQAATPPARIGAARLLADDVVESMMAIRAYLQQVGACRDHVDPHLCNNVGLVERLTDWEESWEVGARYVRQAHLFEAVCDLVSEVKAAQNLAPALTSMIEDCDVELFLVLPRIVLLCFLEEPMQKRSELVRSLLPHRFSKGRDGKAGTAVDPELGDLLSQFTEALRSLEKTSMKEEAWAFVVKRAVRGDIDKEDARRREPATLKLVEALMREVERWSLELQRHCPEDWNQFSAVLVQCLTGTDAANEPEQAFQV
mmetsp:Transcript_97878/g.282397  ORF Transcript_97878/g.282397 Transcript_97878/m.282397 type:complete len:507 (+) Transcript_97878:108-1628(+)